MSKLHKFIVDRSVNKFLLKNTPDDIRVFFHEKIKDRYKIIDCSTLDYDAPNNAAGRFICVKIKNTTDAILFKMTYQDHIREKPHYRHNKSWGRIVLGAGPYG
jgi:hypothetical protein